jgi:hypothetical protein
MSSISLPLLLQRNLEALDSLLTQESHIVQDTELAGLIHAAWIRLKNWETDIKNEEKLTLSKLPQLSSQTAEIVRTRMKTLLQTIQEVKDTSLSAETASSKEFRSLVNKIFTAAVNVSRTTRALRRIVDADSLCAEIAAVAEAQGYKESASPQRAQSPTTPESNIIQTPQKSKVIEPPSVGSAGAPRIPSPTVPRIPPPAPQDSTNTGKKKTSFVVGTHVEMGVFYGNRYQLEEYIIVSVRFTESRPQYQLEEKNGQRHLDGEWVRQRQLYPCIRDSAAY